MIWLIALIICTLALEMLQKARQGNPPGARILLLWVTEGEASIKRNTYAGFINSHPRVSAVP